MEMEGEAAAAFLKIAVENLIDITKDEVSLIRGVAKNAEKLGESLETVQKFLNDAGTGTTVPSEDVKMWLQMIKDLVYDADDVLDQVNHHHDHDHDHHHNRCHGLLCIIKAIPRVLTCCFSSSLNTYLRRRRVAHRIKKINEKFKSLNSEAVGFEFGLVSDLTNPLTPCQGTTPVFVGREAEVLRSVGILVNATEEEERILSVVAIMGMGGMGKTTLAREIFDHERMENRFGHLRIWLSVSQVFDPVCIFEKILRMLACSFNSHESMEALLEKLHEALKGKSYLLVLDDVWNEDPQKWEDFMTCLSRATSTKGNGIVITTRSEDVASIAKPLHTHVLEGLSKEDCWSIIKAKAFSQGDDPSRFEAMGGNIAGRCCGLPLAADVVGGVLYSASMEKWISTEQSWLTKDERQIILEALTSSFDNLSLPSLKKCFVYCSIFPTGHHISKQAIIELWMAEGFLEGEDMESVGNSFFNALIHSSLLVAAERDGGNIESCVMYDLLHDMASYILASSDHINQHHYLVYRVDVSNPIPKDTANYLRALIFIGEINDHAMFSSFTSLHALTLDCDQLTELPSSIVKLRHLRNLNISNTSIERLPDWIKELHHLQTLNALTESLKELPSTFKYLINLRHLYIPSHVKLPGIRRFSDLRALKFRVGDREGYRIEELGSLMNLREIHIPNVGKVHDKHEAEKAKLFMKPKLSMLQLEWDDADREGLSNDESVLEGLQPTPGLEKLKIKGYGGRRFPPWILRMEVLHGPVGSWVGLNKLVEIKLSKCTECEEIPILGHLTNLKSLYMWALWNVKSIKSSFYGSDRCGSGFIFPALESMLLSDMPELREWEEGEFHNATATRLRVLPRLQSLKIYHCKNLESLPIWLFSEAQNLTELDIMHCSKLKKLPAGVQFLSSLELMTIKGCRALKSIAHQSGGKSVTSLRSLDIRDCQDLVAMVEYSQAPLLNKVSMAELKSLENLPWFINCLAGSHFLEELTIVGVPKFMSTSSLENWPFIKLQNWRSMLVGRDQPRSVRRP